MIQSEVFICGDGILSHPVSYLFHLDNTTLTGTPSSETLGGKKLVIADGRIASLKQLKEWIAEVPDQIPFLLLCPTREQHEALASAGIAMPSVPTVATMIQKLPNDEAVHEFYVEALAYGAQPDERGEATGKVREAVEQGIDDVPSAELSAECACTDFDSLSQVFVSPEAVNGFYARLLDAMTLRTTLRASDINPPSGVKYVKTTLNTQSPFTYDYKVKNKSAGAVTITWTIWGFLGQTQTENTQYLIVESSMSLAPGDLYANDSCDRGYGDNYYFSSLDPTATGFIQLDHGPTSGSGTFSFDISVPISYKNPLGGYDIWTFADTTSSSATSWDCTSISAGNTLGSKWYMTTPCNGDNVPDKWDDAFNGWGHVSELTAAGSSSLQVKTYSAWSSTTLAAGSVNVAGAYGWQGSRFHGSSCSPGMYWSTNAAWSTYTWAPGFKVDFSSLQP